VLLHELGSSGHSPSVVVRVSSSHTVVLSGSTSVLSSSSTVSPEVSSMLLGSSHMLSSSCVLTSSSEFASHSSVVSSSSDVSSGVMTVDSRVASVVSGLGSVVVHTSTSSMLLSGSMSSSLSELVGNSSVVLVSSSVSSHSASMALGSSVLSGSPSDSSLDVSHLSSNLVSLSSLMLGSSEVSSLTEFVGQLLVGNSSLVHVSESLLGVVHSLLHVLLLVRLLGNLHVVHSHSLVVSSTFVMSLSHMLDVLLSYLLVRLFGSSLLGVLLRRSLLGNMLLGLGGLDNLLNVLLGGRPFSVLGRLLGGVLLRDLLSRFLSSILRLVMLSTHGLLSSSVLSDSLLDFLPDVSHLLGNSMGLGGFLLGSGMLTSLL